MLPKAGSWSTHDSRKKEELTTTLSHLGHRGTRRALNADRKLRSATDPYQALPITFLFSIDSYPCHYVFQNSNCVRVGRFDYSVVHPLTFSTRTYDSGASQIRQVTADLGLIRLKNLHEKADTYLVFPHQV